MRSVKRLPILRNTLIRLTSKLERIIIFLNLEFLTLHQSNSHQALIARFYNHLRHNETALGHLFRHAQIGAQMAM